MHFFFYLSNKADHNINANCGKNEGILDVSDIGQVMLNVNEFIVSHKAFTFISKVVFCLGFFVVGLVVSGINSFVLDLFFCVNPLRGDGILPDNSGSMVISLLPRPPGTLVSSSTHHCLLSFISMQSTNSS